MHSTDSQHSSRGIRKDGLDIQTMKSALRVFNLGGKVALEVLDEFPNSLRPWSKLPYFPLTDQNSVPWLS
jgi:hypothetical protein